MATHRFRPLGPLKRVHLDCSRYERIHRAAITHSSGVQRRDMQTQPLQLFPACPGRILGYQALTWVIGAYDQWSWLCEGCTGYSFRCCLGWRCRPHLRRRRRSRYWPCATRSRYCAGRTRSRGSAGRTGPCWPRCPAAAQGAARTPDRDARTLLRRHHRLLSAKWRQPKPQGRPPIPDHVAALIIGLATENSTWGVVRGQGELRRLGYRVAASTIRKICLRRRVRFHRRRDRAHRTPGTQDERLRRAAHRLHPPRMLRPDPHQRPTPPAPGADRVHRPLQRWPVPPRPR